MLAVQMTELSAIGSGGEEVELVLLQEVGSGCYFAVEPSYIEQEVDVIQSPYNNGVMTLADGEDKDWPVSLFVVTGRYFGDDDDSTHIVEALNEAEATSIFIDQLRDEHGHTEEQTEDTDEVQTAFVTSISILQEAIKQRLK